MLFILETWLDDTYSDQYVQYRKDRVGKKGGGILAHVREGFTFISQPTNSSAGGVGLYVKQDLNYTIRTKLSLSNSDFESLWIEIDNQSHKNFICGIIYRHPNSDISSFMDYLNSTAEKIHREKKNCAILGDFNIDLLKYR